MFNKKKIELVAKIKIGRGLDNDVIVDNKLASRHHAVIQKIKGGKAVVFCGFLVQFLFHGATLLS